MWFSAGERSLLLPETHDLFVNCHASTLVTLPGGELLAAFFAGRREGAGDTAIWLSRRGTGSWHRPIRTFAEPDLAHWNPVLHAEGDRVWCFYKVGRTVHDWVTRVAVSEDGGFGWSEPRPLVPGDPAPRGPVKNKLVVLSDGAWLAPSSIEAGPHWDAFTDRSEDRGLTWRRADVPLIHRDASGPGDGGIWAGLNADALWETDLGQVFAWDGVIQPTLWETAPGLVHMLLRSTRGRLYRSDSADGGRSWCPAYATDLPNNNSGLDLASLPDGRLVLAYNPVAGNWGRRFPLSLAGSTDDGESWSPLVDLETEEGEFSYPAVVVGHGEVHVTYTADRRTIVHHRFALDRASVNECPSAPA